MAMSRVQVEEEGTEGHRRDLQREDIHELSDKVSNLRAEKIERCVFSM
jgi:hypothetical protein